MTYKIINNISIVIMAALAGGAIYSLSQGHLIAALHGLVLFFLVAAVLGLLGRNS